MHARRGRQRGRRGYLLSHILVVGKFLILSRSSATSNRRRTVCGAAARIRAAADRIARYRYSQKLGVPPRPPSYRLSASNSSAPPWPSGKSTAATARRSCTMKLKVEHACCVARISVAMPWRSSHELVSAGSRAGRLPQPTTSTSVGSSRTLSTCRTARRTATGWSVCERGAPGIGHGCARACTRTTRARAWA